MIVKEIDLSTWDRKEHYEFFSRSDMPFYNTNFNLNVTGLREYVKANELSLNNTIIYITVAAMLSIRNFLYRIEDGKVVEYNRIDPLFACIKNNEELFRLITIEYKNDLRDFDESAKKAIHESSQYFDLHLLANRRNFVYISALPWIPFTGIDHTMSLNKDDSIPRVSWGKYYYENEQTFLPYNIQVNHRLIDGIHVGKFYNNLNVVIKDIINNKKAP